MVLVLFDVLACVGGYEDEKCTMIYDELVRVRVKVRAMVLVKVGFRVSVRFMI